MKAKIIFTVFLIVLFGICFHLTDLWCFLGSTTTNGFALFDVTSANRVQACHIVWYADYAIFVILATTLIITIASSYAEYKTTESS